MFISYSRIHTKNKNSVIKTQNNRGLYLRLVIGKRIGNVFNGRVTDVIENVMKP